ncbi:hypothetical protein BJ165DRAFT_1534287 [Panaeolus papilionaceus]|nr:hypothetical protein BJ165DRAFT_1534287 [Panaeolus papilionaceus]
MAPLWPFPVSIRVSIDSTDKFIDLQDHSVPNNTKSTPFWSIKSTKPSGIRGVLHNTGNTLSTVTIQPANNLSGQPGDRIALIDSMIFEFGTTEGDPVIPDAENITPGGAIPASDPSTESAASSSTPNLTSTVTKGVGSTRTSANSAIGGSGSMSTPVSAFNSTATSVTASSGDGRHKGENATLIVVLCVVLGLSVLLVLGGMIWWALRKRYDRRNRLLSVDNMFDEPADANHEKDTDVLKDDFTRQNHKPPSDMPECLDTPSHSEGEITSASSSHHLSEDSSDWCRRFGAAYDELSRKRSLKQNDLDGTTHQLILETTPFNRFSHPSGFDRR